MAGLIFKILACLKHNLKNHKRLVKVDEFVLIGKGQEEEEE